MSELTDTSAYLGMKIAVQDFLVLKKIDKM